MASIYVCEQGAEIGISENRFEIRKNGQVIKEVPEETVESIYVIGRVQLTASCIEECLKRGIVVVFLSSYGRYYGKLISTAHENITRQRKQVLYSDGRYFPIARKMIRAKINNQIVILRRYAKAREMNENKSIFQMQLLEKRVDLATTENTLMGFEGNAAKIYFQTLSHLINPEFAFEKRSRRPPLDPFNAILSYCK